MADAKKPDKGKPSGGKPSGGKPASSGPSTESTIVLIVIVAIMFIVVILPALLTLFGTSMSAIFPSDLWQRITTGFEHFVATASYVSIFLSLVFICAIVWINILYGEVKKKMQEKHEVVKPATVGAPGPEQLHNTGPDPRWRDIESLMQSGNSADWRIAILEADIMLEDMLTQMGYQGESIGEKLKQVDPAHFKTVQDAWKAHKVRNTIAHEGASYQLSRSEADQVIAQFKKVFDEFYFV